MTVHINEEMGERELLSSVKQYMIPVDTVLYPDQTIAQACDILRKREYKQKVTYLYVVDSENCLLGIVPTRHLIFEEGSKKIEEVMETNVVSLSFKANMKEAFALFSKKKLLAVPVVDQENHLLGVVEVFQDNELWEKTHIQSQVQSDVFQFIGLSVEQAKIPTVWAEYRFRMPWLVCNIIAGLTCAVIGSIFTEVLDMIVIIAMFIPLVLTLSESIAMQSMTMSLPYLHQEKIHWKRFFKRVFKDWRTALVIGVTCAAAMGATFFIFEEATELALIAVGASIVLSMMVSALFGSLLPAILHACRLDPKVAAGPVVLMLVDVAATAIYLSLATYIL
nr:Magnesium transporter MgtE [Chlamydiota bacterium]